MTKVFYNEHDPFAAAWLRELIAFGVIPHGDVDERDIEEIEPWELVNYEQCHFFAGIGGWAYALQLAHWQGPVWTGSCPCQPFSIAGAQLGTDDKRHIWPFFAKLIATCKPPVVFGEQVASKLGRGWLAGVRTDLEDVGYAVGAADLCAAGVGSPHIRQRLYWVAESESQQQHGCRHEGRGRRQSSDCCTEGRMADSMCDGTGRDTRGHPSEECAPAGARREDRDIHDPLGAGATDRRVQQSAWNGREQRWPEPRRRSTEPRRTDGRLHNSSSARQYTAVEGPEGEAWDQARLRGPEPRCPDGGLGNNNNNTGPQGRGLDAGEHGDQLSPWAAGVFVPCLDGKARRVEPGIFPLADGFPNRVGALRGSGNAIVPQVAEVFISSYKEARSMT